MFHPAVSEGGPCRRWLGRHPETDQQNDRVGQVGKEMKGISDDGDRARDNPQDHLKDEEEKDRDHRNPGSEQPVLDSDPLVGHVVKVANKEIRQGAIGSFPYSQRFSPRRTRNSTRLDRDAFL